MAEHNRKKSKTSTLLRGLFKSPDLEKFIESNAEEMEMPSFPAYISGLCQASGEIPEQVIRRSAIERTYGHQLFNGTRNPSRDKVIQLAIGLQLDVEGAQKLLQIAQKSVLYPKIKRDAALMHCIYHKKDIYETQAVLQGLGLTLLSDALANE